MKFVIGKFSNEVFHALTKKEVTLLFKLAPDEWTQPITGVILSAKMFSKIKVDRPVMYSDSTKQLSIYSRGLDRQDIARQVLIELAVVAGELEPVNPNEASNEMVIELDTFIKPYMDRFLKSRV